MDPGDDVRAGVVEDLVAALEPGEVVEHEVALAGVLQHRAHGAVGDHDSLSQHVEEAGVERQMLHVTEVARHLSEVTGGRPRFPGPRAAVGWLNDRPRSDPGPDRGADEAVPTLVEPVMVAAFEVERRR